ncbi:Na+/H+ antiporter subunit E [Thermococcus barophilus]|uniref:Membrane bound subgroup 4b [NiFe]-hydrogenase MBH(B)3, subunit Mbh(B)3A n=1 Tax=Thermococcus barophilus TaxID=55802 RepID=A0A0S1XD05_THEBA|nr:Na+/H+ antiporter subunit E [Thermococcus barophilus]ALM75660.1 Membrane bound subgroup 4b [NiFe]-hydrogenase MBH(b)3, subunit Mbh(b)3A [Thermococcus barophilus]
MRGVIPTALLAFITYILFTGSARPFDLLTGLIVAIGVGLLVGKYLVQSDSKALNPVRWLWLGIYFIWYMIVAEVKAHLDVMVRIISGKYEPGIVKVPIDVKTDYAKTLIANSITNTPGTVVVDLDDEYMYVNWINVTTEDPEKAKKEICEDFEKYAKKIFE